MSRVDEIVFLAEETNTGYTARAVGESIFTQADDFEQLKENVRDAIKCHFEPEKRPKFVSIELLNPLTKEKMAELDRRIEYHKQNPEDTLPWEEVKARLRRIA